MTTNEGTIYVRTTTDLNLLSKVAKGCKCSIGMSVFLYLRDDMQYYHVEIHSFLSNIQLTLISLNFYNAQVHNLHHIIKVFCHRIVMLN